MLTGGEAVTYGLPKRDILSDYVMEFHRDLPAQYRQPPVARRDRLWHMHSLNLDVYVQDDRRSPSLKGHLPEDEWRRRASENAVRSGEPKRPVAASDHSPLSKGQIGSRVRKEPSSAEIHAVMGAANALPSDTAESLRPRCVRVDTAAPYAAWRAQR